MSELTAGRKLINDWDMEHFKRIPIADSSFQYRVREDLIQKIDALIAKTQSEYEEPKAKE